MLDGKKVLQNAMKRGLLFKKFCAGCENCIKAQFNLIYTVQSTRQNISDAD